MDAAKQSSSATKPPRTNNNSRRSTNLKLIHLWRPDTRPRSNLLQLRGPPVTHPDTARLALDVQALQALPQLPPLGRRAHRRVDQKQIDVSFLARIQRLDAAQAALVAALHAALRGQDLGRDEELGARNARGAHCGADGGFVAVVLRRVDVPVASGEGG